MNNKILFQVRNKFNVAVLVAALVIGGISANATGILNSKSGGYVICVNPKSTVVTHPVKIKCPIGFKKLVLGAQGLSGKDGRTLWNGIKDPELVIGQPGDMFINTSTKVLFGPKDIDKGWPTGVSLIGPQGPGGGGSIGPAGAPGTNATLTCAQGGTCIVGNMGPGGGIVFYVSPTPNSVATPWRYMEAAQNTWSGGTADPFMKWCSNTNFVSLLTSGANVSVQTSPIVGLGFFNTKMMLGSCLYGASNMATSYNGGGRSDWFLPSKDELNKLYLEKLTVGGFENSFYWSSFENDASNAFYQHFQNGDQNFRLKSESNYVRPVRAF